MTDVADGFGQVVQVVKTLVVALELWHILGPGSQDEQGAGSTGLETAALRLPVVGDGVCLNVYQAQMFVQGDMLHALLAFRDAGCHQHAAALGISRQLPAALFPDGGIFCWYAVGAAMEVHLLLVGLA